MALFDNGPCRRLELQLPDRKYVGAVAGLEYNGGCWVLRVVGQHVDDHDGDAKRIDLSFSSGSTIGGVRTSPLELLRGTVPDTCEPTIRRPRTRTAPSIPCRSLMESMMQRPCRPVFSLRRCLRGRQCPRTAHRCTPVIEVPGANVPRAETRPWDPIPGSATAAPQRPRPTRPCRSIADCRG